MELVQLRILVDMGVSGSRIYVVAAVGLLSACAGRGVTHAYIRCDRRMRSSLGTEPFACRVQL